MLRQSVVLGRQRAISVARVGDAAIELRTKEDERPGFGSKRSIEGRHREVRRGSERRQIGVRPVLGRGVTQPGHAAKPALQPRRLIHVVHALILEPSIVSVPSLLLVHDLVAHDRFGGQETEQSQLREPAEEEARVRVNGAEPVVRNHVMNMPLVGEGDPDVDIREKK